MTMGDERKIAKEGDVLSARAGAKLRKSLPAALFQARFGTREKCTVRAKGAGQQGQWICVDCGELPENNMQVHGHAKSHRIAWLGPEGIEVP